MKQLIWILIIFVAGSCCSNSKLAKNEASNTSSIPVCLQDIIKKHEAEEKQNPPIKIYSYQYKGSLVYYETAPCCDMFSNLYSSNCELMGHPDGGFTGRGDGNILNFDKEATDQKIVWEDKR